jgi:EAL domain-containing protein (putative c-di-GMP-specific phosphodiesterase class I)
VRRSGAGGSAADDGIVAAFQPIVDLRDESVVGFEALARPRDGRSPEELFRDARAQGRVAEVDRRCRDAALAAAGRAGLGAPFLLFINADPGALEDELPDGPRGGATLIMEITERSLTERPEAVLRTLTALRLRGWGVSLDDVGADSRSLALMPLLYPDVIKLDLRLLDQREPDDVARVVTAVGAEAERRHATVLAEGIDSEAHLATALAAGATLGQGYLLGAPGPLPDPLPPPGRPVRLAGAGGAPDGPVPYERVTNWRRPQRGPLALAEQAAALLSAQAAALGATGLLLASPPPAAGSDRDARYGALERRLGLVGVIDDDPALASTWTEVALGPGFGACFVAREAEGEWRFAVSYDREIVVECALLLMARMPSVPPGRR